MTQKVPKLSIVCPAYEEEDALPAFHQELVAVVNRLQADYDIEILYVDDGSRDGTLGHLRQWARADRRVRFLSLSRNFGHQAAITAGMEYARGDIIITMDSDLQHPPELIPQLLDEWKKGHEIVLTIRGDDPGLGWFKRWSSHSFYVFMRWFSDTETRPAAADFRLMTRKTVEALLRLRESHRFLRGMVKWLGFPTAEVPYQPGSRVAGVSKFNIRRLAGFACDAIFSFSRMPLRLPVILGALAFLSGVGLAGFALLHWLLAPPGSTGAGTTSILVALCLIGGCILASLGVLGEYIGRIYEQVKGRPLYVLKETDSETASGALRSPARAGVEDRGTAAA
jgi:dolichol-phosphate mannosyltransferase